MSRHLEIDIDFSLTFEEDWQNRVSPFLTFTFLFYPNSGAAVDCCLLSHFLLNNFRSVS